jgi:hypothetical protein
MVPTNSYPSPSYDILVSQGLGSSSTMSSTFAIGVRTGTADDEVTLSDIIQRLKVVEDIVWPMQLVPDPLTTVETTVREEGQQQSKAVGRATMTVLKTMMK